MATCTEMAISLPSSGQTHSVGTIYYGKKHLDGDLPAVIQADGSQEWYKNGSLHRDGDLPAIMKADGTNVWYKEGQLHRGHNLPALIKADGRTKWYIRGEMVSTLKATLNTP